jgi:homoserine O-succinyltransferase
MDDIRRIKSDCKHSGVFDCTRLADHPLIAGTSSRFKIPHSRWNSLSEDELTGCGYHVLTRAGDAGVDTFIKQHNSMFVFFQGHPEYEPHTLLLEYRRDVGRYLRGETDIYPLMPRSYFDPDTVIALTSLQQEAKTRPAEQLVAKVSGILEKIRIENTWQSTAASIYRNWLQHICAQKKLQLQRTRDAVEARQIDSQIPALTATESVSTSAVFTAGHPGSSTTSTPAGSMLTIL